MNPATDHDPELPLSAEEELVAYLDGELDDEGVRQVEARLTSDPDYRAELTRLQQAWDCLDQLPETAVDPSFTRSTIEMVALAAQEELTQAQTVLPKLKRKQQYRSAGIVFAAIAFGFVVTTLLWPSPQEKLAADLPVLENLDLYLPIDNVAFLRTLSQEVTFPSGSSLTVSDADIAQEVQKDARLPVTTVSDITQLSATDKSKLAVNQQRFSRLNASEQDGLRKLATEVLQAKDHAALQNTLVQYHQWLTELSPGAQADLAGLPTEERVAEVKKMIDQQQQRRQRELSAEDREKLLHFLARFLNEHRVQFLDDVPDSKREEMQTWLAETDERQRTGTLLMMFLQKRRTSDKRFSLDQQQWQTLIDQLSPAAQKQWGEMETPSERMRLIQSWAGTAVRHQMIERANKRDAREISQEELKDYFSQKLSTDERARLLAMPSDEMDRELRQMMLEEDKPGRGFSRHGFGFPPPPHGGPAGRPERGPRGKGPPRHDGERLEGGPHPEFGRPPEGPPRHGPPGRERDPNSKRPPHDFEGRFPRGSEDGPRRPRRGDFDSDDKPPQAADNPAVEQ